MDTNSIEKSRTLHNQWWNTTTKYFKPEKGTRQRDPVSAYLFILVLEIAIIVIKENKNIKGLIFLTIYSYILLMQMIQYFFQVTKIL